MYIALFNAVPGAIEILYNEEDHVKSISDDYQDISEEWYYEAHYYMLEDYDNADIQSIPGEFKTQEICDDAFDENYDNICFIPDRFKTQEMCDKTVVEDPLNLKYVPDRFKTQEMCDEATKSKPYCINYVPNRFKTQEMCDDAIEEEPYKIHNIPNRFKTVWMCNKAIIRDPIAFKVIPDYLITCDMCTISESYEGGIYKQDVDAYKKRKEQRALIKEQIIAVAWHPDRVTDWCFDEEEKKDLKKLWGE